MRLPTNWEYFLKKTIDLSEFYLNLDVLISRTKHLIPAEENIFHVFRSLAPEDVRCVLYGEDPYPRLTSANGVAFWDAEIDSWETRTNGSAMKNILKALLVARGWADYHTSIAECRRIALEKKIKSPPQLFPFWLKQGVLLINTSLTFGGNGLKKTHFDFWHPFHRALIRALNRREDAPVYILWGRKAWRWEEEIINTLSDPGKIIKQGHPTFIHQFLKKDKPAYSPFVEIRKRTGLKWL